MRRSRRDITGAGSSMDSSSRDTESYSLMSTCTRRAGLGALCSYTGAVSSAASSGSSSSTGTGRGLRCAAGRFLGAGRRFLPPEALARRAISPALPLPRARFMPSAHSVALPSSS